MNVCSDGHSKSTKMAAMLLYGYIKTLKNLLQDQESSDNDCWYRALVTDGLPN